MQLVKVARINRAIYLCFLALGLSVPVYWAQLSSTGTVSGTVTDKSGALVPQAAVTLVNTDTGVHTTTHTNNEGSFTVPGLLTGTYSVTISKDGFQTVVVQGIRV